MFFSYAIFYFYDLSELFLMFWVRYFLFPWSWWAFFDVFRIFFFISTISVSYFRGFRKTIFISMISVSYFWFFFYSTLIFISMISVNYFWFFLTRFYYLNDFGKLLLVFSVIHFLFLPFQWAIFDVFSLMFFISVISVSDFWCFQ